MAVFSWPATAKITYHSFHLVYPGQNRLQSQFGQGSIVIGRSAGFFVGTVDIARFETRNEGDGEIRALLANLNGMANTVNIPLNHFSKGGIPTGTSISITGTPTITGGKLNVATDHSHATQLLQKGDYVRIGNRLYLLISNQTTTGGLLLAPTVLPTTGEINLFWENLTVHARFIGETLEWPRTPEFTGPFSFQYEEVPN